MMQKMRLSFFFFSALCIASPAYLKAQSPVVWDFNSLVNTEIVTANPGGLKKILGGNASWNADASSDKNLIGDGAVTFTARLASHVAVGLDAANFNRTYSGMPYVIRLTSSNTAAVYEDGSSKFNLGNYTESTVFTIQRTGTVITYLKDGVVQYTSVIPSTGELVVDTSFYKVNSELFSVYLLSDDCDNDHMADAWELQYINLPSDPTEQDILDALSAFSPSDNTLDNDSSTNFEEYQNGTDPTLYGSDSSAFYWVNLVKTEDTGSNGGLKKITGGTAWNADASDTDIENIPPWDGWESDFYITFSAAAQSYLALGIGKSNNNRTYTGMTHAVRLTSANIAGVYESGTLKFDLGSYSPSTIFGIRRIRDVVEYLKDGVVVYTSANLSREIVVVDTSFYTVDSEILWSRYNYLDVDDDGLADSWERLYLPEGASLQDLLDFDPLGDADGDGVQTSVEYREKTDPTDEFDHVTYSEWGFIGTIKAWGYFGEGISTLGSYPGWFAAMNSKRMLGDGKIICAFTSGSDAAVGMSLTFTSFSTSYTELSHGIRVVTAGTATIVENGTSKFNLGDYHDGTLFTIERIEGGVRYYKDGYLMYTSTLPSIGTSYILGCLNTDESSLFAKVNNGDIDNDGMRDGWEFSHLPIGAGMAELVAFTSDGDPDNDGHKNWQEYEDNSDPNNPFDLYNGIEWTDFVNTSVIVYPKPNGNLTKTTGSSAWNADAVSKKRILTDGGISFAVYNGNYVAVGLDYDNTNRTYTNMAYAIRIHSNGEAVIFENGSQKHVIGPICNENIFSIQRLSNVITYYRDGYPVYTSVTPSYGELTVDTAFYTLNSSIASAKIATGDVDDDQMADSWELFQLGLPSPEGTSITAQKLAVESFSPDDDGDEDEALNLNEYLDDTDTNDPWSHLLPVTWNAATFTNTQTITSPDPLNPLNQISNGGLKKSSGANAAYNADAQGTQKLVGDGYLSFSGVTGGQLYIGLNHDDAGTTAADLDYSILCLSSGLAEVRENGTSIINIGEYGPYTRFGIERIGHTIYYYKDSILVHTSAKPSTGEMLIDTSFYTLNAQVSEVRLSTDDLDNDHMNDSWERPFLSLPSSYNWDDQLLALASFQPDGHQDDDGVTNLQEFMDGTDPDDALSFLEPITWTSLSSNASTSGSLYGGLGKLSGTNAYNAGAISTTSLAADAQLSFRVAADDDELAVGFTDSSTAGTTFTQTDLDYAIVTLTSGLAEIRENSVLIGSAGGLGTYDDRTVFTITRSNGIIRYYKDNQLFHTSNTSNTNVLVVDSSFRTVGGALSEARMSSDDMDGDGLPDAWEILVLPKPSARDELLAFLPQGDNDGDGYTNIEEYEQGTDPFDSSSHPSGSPGSLQPIVWKNHVNTASSGSVGGLVRTAAIPSNSDAGAISTHPIADSGTLRFRLNQNDAEIFVGLNAADLDATGADLDFAFKAGADGYVTIFESGVQVMSFTPAAYSSSTTFEMVRLGTAIDYKLDGITVHSSTAPTTLLVVDTAIVTSDALIREGRYNFRSPLAGDSDGDWMLDSWEIAQFGDLSHDETDDTDGDGLSDREEFELGLDPNENDFTAATPAGNNRETITFDDYGHLNTVNGANNASYTIDADSNLTGKN